MCVCNILCERFKTVHVLCVCRHERYLGMWSDDCKSGPGMFVTSTGSYGEAIFSAGNIAVSRCKEIVVYTCRYVYTCTLS